MTTKSQQKRLTDMGAFKKVKAKKAIPIYAWAWKDEVGNLHSRTVWSDKTHISTLARDFVGGNGKIVRVKITEVVK